MPAGMCSTQEAAESAGVAWFRTCEELVIWFKCGMGEGHDKAREFTEPGGKVRLYVDAPLAEGAQVTASEGQAHYLLHVMRAKAGDRVSLFNGRDGEWLAQIRGAG